MATEGFIPTHALVSEEGEQFELVKAEGAFAFVDLATYYIGGREILLRDLELVGTKARKLSAEEVENYKKTSAAYDAALFEVRTLTERLEVARAKVAKLSEKMHSATEAVS